jgi:two-component system, OmpR family, sensor histidine kinase KdpD
MDSDRFRSLPAGIAVATAGVAVTTGLVYALKQTVPVVGLGVVYLLVVLLVATYWGLWLSLATALLSAAAFNFFHIPPTGRFTISESENWVALGVFFVAAVVVSTLTDRARARAMEAEAQRREADLLAELARLLLEGRDPRAALPVASERIASVFGLASAELRMGWVDSDERRVGIPLVAEGTRVGTLLVPRATGTSDLARLRERVTSPLAALVSAALRRERLEEQVVETRALRRSDDLKTALLRAVSHDLRSPLTAIRTAAAAVGSRSVSDEERDELASVIAEESDRLARLVDNLLELSRLETGAAEPQREWVSVDELVEAAAESPAMRGVALDVALEPELPLLKVDAAQLERVLGNLLENAARHSNGQPVSVRARRSDGRVFIRVSDQGPGIPPEELPRIFEPFYRAPGATGTGAGLGLAIARGFVEANGGRIRAESLPGQGATFTIDLPVEEAPS